MTKSTKNTTKNTAGSESSATGVAVSGQFSVPQSREDVPAALAALKAKLAELRKDQPKELSLDVMYNHQKIADVATIKELLEISASIHAREAAFKEEIKRYSDSGNDLSQKIKPWSQNDLTVDKWEKVIAKAIFEKVNARAIEIIENSITKLSKFVSEEEKLKNELTGIMADASGLID